MKKIVSIIGARPQFIKAAPVSRAMADSGLTAGCRFREIICHTGQHYDTNMSQIFFDQLGIQPPRYNLGVRALSHGAMTGEMLGRIEKVLIEESPDWVLVYGDTNSTLSGALAAAKLDIPIAHVEAGLRSYNRKMPEEINRVLTDHMAKLLFCPTPTAMENLAGEGITEGVHLVGDVMYDAFLNVSKAARQQSDICQNLHLLPGRYALATIHRQENTNDGNRLNNILSALQEIASTDCPVVLPLHPRTRVILSERGIDLGRVDGLHILEPVGYLEMVALETKAGVILTDSGGIQKEAYFARVPCITLREETEWKELETLGVNQVVGTDREAIVGAYRRACSRPYPQIENLYGEGCAAKKIVLALNAASRLELKDE